MERGGREGRKHTVNNLKHLSLSFTERLPKQRSQLKSLTHWKCSFIFFPLDTYRENEEFGRVSRHRLPLQFRLAVDELWLFLRSGGLPSGKRDVWINRKCWAAEAHSRRKHTGTLPFVGNLGEVCLHSSSLGSHSMTRKPQEFLK